LVAAELEKKNRTEHTFVSDVDNFIWNTARADFIAASVGTNSARLLLWLSFVPFLTSIENP
jgi:hypothetical protein